MILDSREAFLLAIHLGIFSTHECLDILKNNSHT